MAIKTFSDGVALPASDINSFLTNAGLVYITETTASAVATKAVTGVFSAAYENYRLIITNLTSNVNGLLTCQLGTAATAYSYGFAGYTYAGVADTLSLNAGTFWTFARTTATSSGSVIVDIYRPQLVAATTFTASGITATGSLAGGGIHTTALAYTDFTLALFTAATFSANIKIFGYRQA